MIDALPLGEIDRQHAPLDAPLRHIKDGIEHRSHTQGARSSTAFGGGDQIFDPLPFLVSQVAWIDCFVHLPIVPTCKDFSDRLLVQLSWKLAQNATLMSVVNSSTETRKTGVASGSEGR